MMVSKQAVLFLSHVIDEQVLQRFYKLYESSHFNYDVYLGLHNESNEEPVISYGQLYSFRLIDFATLNYSPHGKTLYHNTNYVMQKFRKDYPIYDYYWFVEYDVVFTGEWAFLFDYYANKRYDFISSHIEFHNETNNQWCWWNRTTWGETILPKHRLLKSFNPICRYSSAALDFLDKFLQQGVNGHFETIIATALYNYNYSLVDMGEQSAFSEKKEHIHFYLQEKGVNNGTIRWRPVFTQEEINALRLDNKLFHPVKTNGL